MCGPQPGENESLREGRGMNRHDRGNACVVRGGGRGRRRSGSLGGGDGLNLVRGRGRGLRISGSRPVYGRGRGLVRLGGHRDLACEGRLRQRPILVCCGRGRLSLVDGRRRRGGGLGHAEGAAHEGRDALVVRVDGQDNGQVGDGFDAPPLGDQEFGEMLAQGMVLGLLFDDRREGVDERIRHAISLPAGRLLGLCARKQIARTDDIRGCAR